MPFPDPVTWDRKEIYRERRPVKSEPLGSSPVASRWKDSSALSHRDDHHVVPREFSRRGSVDYRRPPGRGRQQSDWHLFLEEPGYGYMSSRSCDRMREERADWLSSSHVDGRYRGGKNYYKVRGYQKDWEGLSWQHTNSSSSISDERSMNGSPVFFGGKPCNGFSDVPIDRRRNEQFPYFGADRHFNLSPAISGGRQSDVFSSAVIEKAHNFSPRILSDRPRSVSPAASGDKPCLGFYSTLIEKTRNGFSSEPVVKTRNRFSAYVAADKPVNLLTTVSKDNTLNGFSGAPVGTAPSRYFPRVAAGRCDNMSPIVSKPCLSDTAVEKKIHNGWCNASVEKNRKGVSLGISAGRPKNLLPSISTNMLGSDASMENSPNGFSYGSADGDKSCHRLFGASIKTICYGSSLSGAAGSSFNASYVMSRDKACNGNFDESSETICNGTSGPAYTNLLQVNNGGKLSNNTHTYEYLQTGCECPNDGLEDSLKHQHEGELCEADGLCSAPRHDKENQLGFDWKPLKWTRSGNLSLRGNSRSIPVNSKEAIDESQQINSATLCSPTGGAANCVTCSATSEETATRKKARLGWGQGLAKYEKKIVDDPCGSGKQNEICCPKFGGDGTSPATPTSAACSTSPAIETKSFKRVNLYPRTVEASCSSSLGGSNTVQSRFEKVDMSFVSNELNCLVNILHSHDQCPTSSGSESTNAMCKLLSWKIHILKAVEMTDSEMESLESEIQSSKSEYKNKKAAFSLDVNSRTKLEDTITACNARVMLTPLQVDSSEVRDDIDSPETATSMPEVPSLEVDATMEVENGCQFSLGISTERSCISCDVSSMDQVSNDLARPNNGRMDLEEDFRLSSLISASNKEDAGKISDKLAQIIPKNGASAFICQNSPNELSIRFEIAKRKKLLRFTEKAITLKYRALQWLWKEDVRLLEIRKNRPKSLKCLELGSRTSQYVHLKSNSSIHSQFSSPEGNRGLVPSSATISLTSKLLSDCPVKAYKDVLKMPPLTLDEKEKQISKFVSYNGLVEDPVAVEKERALMNPWTFEENETFLDKLAFFGKDFRKIASYLDHKTTADCVDFYYKNHKSASFERTRKKQLKFGMVSKPVANDAYLLTLREKWNPESAAADVLAGICGSISSEAISSCVTSSFDHGDVHRRWKHKKVGDKRKRTWTQEEVTQVIDETCSGESCGEMDFPPLDWTDEEKHMLLQAVKFYGNDFKMVSKYVKTRYRDECKAFYSKVKKRIGCPVNASLIKADSKQDTDVPLAIPLPVDPVV